MLAVDGAALVGADHADAVAGAEEREVARDDDVEQRRELTLHALLHRRLGGVGVAGVERAAAEEDPRPVVEVDGSERSPLHPHPVQLRLLEPGERQEGVVLVVGGRVLVPGAEQQERLHPDILSHGRSRPGPGWDRGAHCVHG